MKVDDVEQTLSTTYQFSETGKHLVKYLKSNTEFAQQQFKDITTLTHVGIPEDITKIGNQCFMGCTSLVELTLRGNGAITIGTRGFDHAPIAKVNLDTIDK
jgi:hypothetical protein